MKKAVLIITLTLTGAFTATGATVSIFDFYNDQGQQDVDLPTWGELLKENAELKKELDEIKSGCDLISMNEVSNGH